jgi:hypothetical protein
LLIVTAVLAWDYNTSVLAAIDVFRGGNQRLPNGNTLITCSDKGSAFEVTGDGEIVWEFLNTEIDTNRRASIYHFMRITNPEDYPCLQWLDGQSLVQIPAPVPGGVCRLSEILFVL